MKYNVMLCVASQHGMNLLYLAFILYSSADLFLLFFSFILFYCNLFYLFYSFLSFILLIHAEGQASYSGRTTSGMATCSWTNSSMQDSQLRQAGC
jgi:hypothetical protein